MKLCNNAGFQSVSGVAAAVTSAWFSSSSAGPDREAALREEEASEGGSEFGFG